MVVGVDHTYDSPAMQFPDGRVATATRPPVPDDAILTAEVGVGAADLQFVLDVAVAPGLDQVGVRGCSTRERPGERCPGREPGIGFGGIGDSGAEALAFVGGELELPQGAAEPRGGS